EISKLTENISYPVVMKIVSPDIIHKSDAQEMITEIKGYEILKAVRGKPPRDIQAIKEVIVKVSKLTMENPDKLILLPFHP
ncbi:unnamed protein product, partial [marine sediment metagenome]